jgi:hypothetical protein
MSDNEMEGQTAFDLQPPSPKEAAPAADKKDSKYDVGYGRPPQHSRFKPGQSGNPKGKPKGAKNLSTIVNNAIKEKVVVTENGKRKTISKLEVVIKQLSNKAATGDPKAIQQLLPLVQMIESRAEEAAGSMPALAEADDIVMGSIARRFRQMENQHTAPQASSDEIVPVIPNQTEEEN